MKTLVWVGIGAVAIWLVSAVNARIGVANHLAPDAAIVILAFLAMHKEPSTLALIAVAFGYLVGRQALAPVGVNEAAFVITATVTYLAAGHLAGNGSAFFAVTSGAALICYHLTLYLLLLFGRGHAGFASIAAALLIPNALLTGFAAWLAYPALQWIERRLTPSQTDGLTWR